MIKLFAKFAAVGVVNTLVGYLIIFLFMYGVGISAEVSNAIGYSFGLFLSFVLNKKFTFRSDKRWVAEAIPFLFVFLSSYALNLAALIFLVRELSVHEGIAQILAGGVYVVSSFVLNKRFVFDS